MKNILFKIQQVLTYCAIVIAIITFIIGLGFMTNYYELFYEGTNEMFEYYKTLQILNRVIFNEAVVFVILAFILKIFDIHKKMPGIFGYIYVIVSSIYIIMTSNTILNAIPSYKNDYLAFDFSVMENYKASTFAFDISTIIFILWIIVSIMLILITTINFIRRIKFKKSQEIA
ncbi:hypothetical protein [Defluviitalea phaphyphila]|uniref:hypothetical protein n=1 Tax=Defluviitalea phaphyphila TaxID=1473580 RepID=UPI000731AA53|nr:hypothetical protein [Defluviitalea phaphyphila]